MIKMECGLVSPTKLRQVHKHLIGIDALSEEDPLVGQGTISEDGLGVITETHFFPAVRCTLYAMARACVLGFPACSSALRFVKKADALRDFVRGILHDPRRIISRTTPIPKDACRRRAIGMSERCEKLELRLLRYFLVLHTRHMGALL
jgi:hypothetical protein